MMRKDEIDAAGMNIKSLAQILHRHRRAFNVPARPAMSQAGVPGRLVRSRCRFPQSEISRVFLFVTVSIDALARAGYVACKVDLRELAVFRKRADAIINRFLRPIRVTTFFQALD